jgi:hypothetical protein
MQGAGRDDMSRATLLNVALAALWAIALLAGGLAVYYGLRVAVDAASKIFVAVITGIFGILAAYVTHVFSVQRERGAEQLRRKQERYSEILKALAPYLRSRGDDSDAFATAVLHAYVVGSPAVAEAIRNFMAARNVKSLDGVVSSMRSDLGMPRLDEATTTASLLPTPPAKTLGGLAP